MLLYLFSDSSFYEFWRLTQYNNDDLVPNHGWWGRAYQLPIQYPRFSTRRSDKARYQPCGNKQLWSRYPKCNRLNQSKTIWDRSAWLQHWQSTLSCLSVNRFCRWYPQNWTLNNFGPSRGSRQLTHCWIWLIDGFRRLITVIWSEWSSSTLRRRSTMSTTDWLSKGWWRFGVPNYLIRWIYAFLKNRRQRVQIGKFLSWWLTLNGGMPQGT